MSESKSRPETPPQLHKNGRFMGAKERGLSHYSQLKHKYNHALDTLILVSRQVTDEAARLDAEIAELKATNKQLLEALEVVVSKYQLLNEDVSSKNHKRPLPADEQMPVIAKAMQAITNAKQREADNE